MQPRQSCHVLVMFLGSNFLIAIFVCNLLCFCCFILTCCCRSCLLEWSLLLSLDLATTLVLWQSSPCLFVYTQFFLHLEVIIWWQLGRSVSIPFPWEPQPVILSFLFLVMCCWISPLLHLIGRSVGVCNPCSKSCFLLFSFFIIVEVLGL